MTKNRSWYDFWNNEQSIYVSPRYTQLHHYTSAQNVLSLLPPTRPLVLLDYGCGEALASPLFIAAGVSVVLYDPSPRMQERIKRRFPDTSDSTILTTTVEEMKEKSVDAILLNSVLQYVTKEEFKSLLSVFRRLLREGGMLIVADIVPQEGNSLADVFSLLHLGMRQGFFFQALRGLATTFFSDYRTIRNKVGFSTYTQSEMLGLLQSAGFKARQVPNIGLTPHRMTFVTT